MSDILREEISKIKLESEQKIAALQHELEALRNKSSMMSPKQEGVTDSHRNIKDLLDCPTCKKQVKDAVAPELLKELGEKIKKKELVTCDGCGEIVNRDAADCPTCHGTTAH